MTFLREANSGIKITWTDGTPVTSASTTTAVKPNNPPTTSGYFTLNASPSTSVDHVLSVYLKLVNADVTVTFDLEGSKYTSSTWSNTTTSPQYRVYKLTHRGGLGEEGTFKAKFTAVRSGSTMSVLGATVR